MTYRRRNLRRGARPAVLVAVALLATACSGGDDDAEPPVDDVSEPAADEPAGDDVEPGDDDAEQPVDDADEPAADDPSDGSPVDETLPPEDDATPNQGGTLRFGLEADVDGLNPTSSSLSAPGMTMAGAVFDTLAAIAEDGTAVPYLAESWSSSDDLMQWQVTVRDGVTFHDGTPVDADAMIANFEAQRADQLVGLAVRPFFPAEDAVEKIDERTVQYNTLEPHASFPTYLATQLGLMASPTWLEAALADPTLNQRPVGTGPFVFDSRSEDSVTRFVRNDDWWNGDVWLDAVEFFPISDPADRVDQLLADTIDGLHTTDPAAILDLDEDDTVQQIVNDQGDEAYFMVNSQGAPVDDIRVRRALAAATPKQDLLTLIGLDLVRPASQRFIPESPYYNPDVTQLADDPELAAQLAGEYCAERGTEVNPDTGQPNCTDGRINITYTYQGGSVVAERTADILDGGWSVAFNVAFDAVNQQDLIARAALGQYDVVGWRGFGAIDPSVDNVWLLCRTIDVVSLNWVRWCDEERDALLLQAQAEPDETTRIGLYQRVEELMNEAATYIYINHVMWDVAYAESVRGACSRTSPEGVPLACVRNGTTWVSPIWLD